MPKIVRWAVVAAAVTALSGVGAASLPGAALAQTAPASDPNRLFADSKLIVKDRISVEVVGSGPDLILVPGLDSSRQTWKRTAERLRGKYRLHLVQVAGFSGEPARANATGRILAPTAEAIDAYIVEAGLAPAVYIGHSLGGTMGLYLAEHHPEHLKKVLVVDSLPFYGVLMGGPTATADQLRPMADRIEAMMSAPTGPAADPTPMLARMVKDPDGLKTVVGWSRLSDGAVGGRAMADDMTLDLRAGLPAVQTPITLIYPFDAGMGVPLAPWDALYNSQFAPLPHKTLVRVDDSRHFVMLDQPAKFDAALDAFLAG
jgi:pimeloyl-ACP methyl ester carboxylesterase